MSAIKPVRRGERLKLKDRRTNDTGAFKDKEEGLAALEADLERLQELQELLFADGRRGLLLVFQAMDTGGKDGAINRVAGAFNPQGVRVSSFKVPTKEEASHDFLWRIHREAPPRGMIGVFNRSHYEDVLVVRVKGLAPESVWRPRYARIRQFEKLLADGGIAVLKFFLHVSKEEQRRRLEARLKDPSKHWKFNPGDLAERKLWRKYEEAYEEALSETSEEWAPWYIIPADRKWYRDAAIARLVVKTLESMRLRFPPAPAGLEKIEVK